MPKRKRENTLEALKVIKNELAHRSLNKTNWEKRRHTISSIDGIVAAGPLAAVVGNHGVATRSTNYQTYAGEVRRIGVHARLQTNVTPLMLAIQHKRNDVIRDMLSNAGHVLGNASRYPYPPRANVHARDQYGKTALHYAARSKPEYLEMLLRAGADPDARGAVTGETAMHLAMRNVRDPSEQLEILLQYGASVNVRDRFMKTPLHIAVIGRNYLNPIKILLENGAEADARDRDGRTPLHIAVLGGSADVVKLLLEHGANVNARDDAGDTPLALADFMADEYMGLVSKADRARVIAVLRRAGGVM
jgi:ankyrin repeat protein